MKRSPEPQPNQIITSSRSVAALTAWAILILVLSVIPIPQMVPGKFMAFSSDSLAHTAFYIVLGALFLWAFPKSSRLTGWARASASTLAYGLTIELIQAMLPWRSFELTDIIADAIGGGVGAGLAILFPSLYLFNLSRRI